ncbi:MAG: bifunctional glutamine synthetase adenylyltransferase/deadenyltransferase, partial [Pseudomonadota bacterium]|nr:bifunctional glutamine synthetase adenylyltransferase/deadenyltransferase [Pseudomonadota bacterium]
SEVMGSLSVMHVSDSLTWLAEVLVDAALKLATAHVQEKYGCPADEQSQSQPIRFIVLAYGKLGGIELSYSSDLDLVFVYDAGASGMTNGARSIEVERYYIRLGQRLVHVFNSQTALGTLYEVDTRLRPSGASGLLVTSLQAYKKYQFEHAWTWEHQALVRSRAIAGEAETVQAFNTIRHEVLGQQREPQALKEDVLKMREKMREHLGSKAAECFDIKQDKGGIVDIEFLVQYLVLREAHQHGKITRWTDNVRQLDALAQANVLSQAQAQQLKQHYLSYRAKLHQLALAGEGRIVSDDQYHTERQQVSAIWERVFNLSN